MSKIERMKQNCFDVMRRQFDAKEQAERSLMVCNECPQIFGVNGMNFTDPNERPLVRIAQIDRVLSKNFATLEQIIKENQDQLALVTTWINHNRTALQKIKSQISNDQARETELQSEASEVEAKIAWTQTQLKLHQQEYHTVQDQKTQLASHMTPKQVSFLLQKSVEKHDAITFNSLADRAFDVNFQNANQDTLLHTSIKYNHKQLLQMLLLKHPNVNLQDKDGNTPSHLAIQKQDLGLLKQFVSLGTDVTLVNKDGSSLLHYAAATRKIVIVKYLLEECPQKGLIKVTAQDIHGNSCLKVAQGADVKAYLQLKISDIQAQMHHTMDKINDAEINKGTPQHAEKSQELIGTPLTLEGQEGSNILIQPHNEDAVSLVGAGIIPHP